MTNLRSKIIDPVTLKGKFIESSEEKELSELENYLERLVEIGGHLLETKQRFEAKITEERGGNPDWMDRQ